MLKIVLLVLAVAIAAVLLYAATRPDTFRVARTARMKAPPESIFPLIDSLRAGEQWSPYYRKDPRCRVRTAVPKAARARRSTSAGTRT